MIEINNIDITLTKGMLYSENKLSQNLHDRLWSEEPQNRIIHLSYWRVVVSQILTKISHSTRIRTILKQNSYNIQYSIQYHLQLIQR